MNKIQNDILRQLHQPWLPSFCNPSFENTLQFYSVDLTKKGIHIKTYHKTLD